MNSTVGVVSGVVVGAVIGFGAATLTKSGNLAPVNALGLGQDGSTLIEVDGVKYKEAELPSDIRTAVYEANNESYQKISNHLSQFALQLSLAKDKNPAVKADQLPALETLVEAPAPSDADMQALYNANKDRLPPNTTYEQLKPDIERYLKNQKLSEALRAKNEEFKAKNRYKVLLAEPSAPQVNLALDGLPTKGTNSSNTLVELADYLCPHCQAVAPEVDLTVKEAGDKFKFVAVTVALKADGLSGTLARGAFCARQQSDELFWKYHEAAFATARAKGWKATDPDNKDLALEVAGGVGADKAKLEACLGSPEAQAYLKKVDDVMKSAGVTGTPTFIVNGRRLALSNGKSLKEQVLSKIQPASH